ncbi:MAG: hypothetical protein LQ350_005354 [Teloschistes chrysophthalmus]|nr:MAG: hypothetical protein LQ350_005354 [Niorma chrysophthalma]
MPQIKQDLNRSGWETTDFPSVCENCLPDNPYVQMLKEDHGAECKICTRPFTIFRWKADRTARAKRTNICLTCARLKNCCQCCMLDLSFGLPIVVRDAALKMVAPGPESSINREYYAQENEREIEEGRGGVEEYEKTDEKARELLRRLANSEPYYKRQRRLEAEEGNKDSEDGQKMIAAPSPGPVRTHDSNHPRPAGAPYRKPRGGSNNNNNNNTARRVFPGTAQLPPQPQDILPPRDRNITSLFITGVEDDLPEHALRTFFTPFGPLRSLICSHRAHCAFINYAAREGAEAAAEHCQGKAVVQGCPLRVQWGRPKPLDSMDKEERMGLARQGRDTARAIAAAAAGASGNMAGGLGVGGGAAGQDQGDIVPAAPPGQGEVEYAALTGN